MSNRALEALGESIFSRMTALARQHNAVNLGQGFPDHDTPSFMMDALRQSTQGNLQYSRSLGDMHLTQSLSLHYAQILGQVFDPLTEIMVTSGCTEAIASSILGLCNPGDGVVTFAPYYDSYPAVCAMGHLDFTAIPLQFPDFAIDDDVLSQLSRLPTHCRILILNMPHNPSGRIFSVDEMNRLACIIRDKNLLVIVDAVYEHLYYEDPSHWQWFQIDGMAERTLWLSSLGKTFALTGAKIGWALGPQPLIHAAQQAHQFITFCAASPMQTMASMALQAPNSYYDSLRKDYIYRREHILRTLTLAGLRYSTPQGSYFVVADATSHPLWNEKQCSTDLELSIALVENTAVVTIPLRSFFEHPTQHLIRFAFCKKTETLELARKKMIP